jgi:hypothetical protein
MSTTTARLGRAFRKLSWLTSSAAPSVRGVGARERRDGGEDAECADHDEPREGFARLSTTL